jgi:hypothetical protein
MTIKSAKRTALFGAGLLLLTIASGSWAADDRSETRLVQGPLFGLQIEQDDKLIVPEGDAYNLKRKKFKIRFFLKKGQQILANFSQNDRLYTAAKKTKSIENILSTEGTGMAETAGNPDKDVWLTDEGWHYWPAEAGEFCRFDSYKEENGVVVGERTIEKFTQDKPIPFNKIDVIYLVYCDYGEDKATWQPVINAIDSFKLIFR